MKRTIFYTITFGLFLIIFTSCNHSGNASDSDVKGDGTDGSILNIISNPKDDLVGEYAIKEGGQAEIKITKESENYFVSITEGKDKWRKPEQLEDVSDKDFTGLFGENWKSYVKAGLHKQMFGIFKVEKGYTYDKHTFESGYFMMFMGGGDVYKLE